jgi:isopenicillin N synthase-like dioxygenase
MLGFATLISFAMIVYRVQLLMDMLQETLEFLTGGYLKAPIHRVAIRPKDQRHVPRLSVIYFMRPGMAFSTCPQFPLRQFCCDSDTPRRSNDIEATKEPRNSP